jgi:hypothetical protein
MPTTKGVLPLVSVQSVSEISAEEYNKGVVNLVKKKYGHLRQKSKGP